MATKQQITQGLLQAVDVVVNKRIDELDFDKTILATVEAVVNTTTGAHRVQYNGGSFIAYSRDNVSYAPKTSVYVQVPQNDFSKRKLIIDKASSYMSDTGAAIVSSNINNYMPIGTNVASLKSEYATSAETGIGLNSYTVRKDGDKFQTSVLLYEKSTGNGVLNINDTQLSTYMQEADALMLKANFHTALTTEQKQQAEAEYALVFDLVFDNVDSTYSTNGEMLDGYQDKTTADRTSVSDTGDYVNQTFSIGVYRRNLDELLAEPTISTPTILPSIKTKIKTQSNLINSFIGLNDTKFDASEKQILYAYYQLTVELQNYNSYSEIYSTYWNWFDISLAKDIQSTKTLSYVIDSNTMTGNPFAFSGYIPQYAIFPIDKENYKYIERIYVYCNGFIEDSTMWQWVNQNRTKSRIPEIENGKEVYRGKDIWTRDIEIYPLKEISDEYNGYKFKLTTPRGAIFYSTKEDETLLIKAQVLFQEYTDKTDGCSLFWFKKDVRVTSQSDTYNYHGGAGWSLVTDKDASQTTVTLSAANNKAYKNEYMCVAYFEEEAITLKQYITIYNEACKRAIKIKSDLGTTFKFDAGSPTLTCMIGETEDSLQEEFFEYYNTVKRADSAFQFVWSVRTDDGQTIALDELDSDLQKEIEGTLDYNVKLSLQRRKQQIAGVEYPRGIYGNQVLYPASKFASNGTLTFECQVYTTDELNADGMPRVSYDYFYSIGNAELTLYNQGMANANEFTVVIENGNQVFQYSETGVTPVQASGVTPTDFRHTEPLELQPLKAHLYYANGIEVSQENYSVRWVYPLENSLIIPPTGLSENPLTKLVDTIVGTETEFTLAESYDYNASNNQIQCVIEFSGETYTKDTELFFGKIGDNGTNGTDIVAKITVDGAGNVLDNQPLTAFLNNSGQLIRWNTGHTSGVPLRLRLFRRSEEIPSTEITNVKWDTANKLNNTLYVEIGSGTDNVTANLMWNPNKEVSGAQYRCQLITVSASLEGIEQYYHCTLPFCVVHYKGSRVISESNNEFINGKITIDWKQQLKQILYNADGRNPQYDKNLGIKLNGLDGRPVVWKTYGGAYNYRSSSRKDSIPFVLSADKEHEDLLNNSISNYHFNDVFVSTGDTPRYDVDRIYVLPRDTYNGESVDNAIVGTVYTSTASASQIAGYEAAKTDFDKECAAKLKQLKLDLSSLQWQKRSATNSTLSKQNSSFAKLVEQLAQYNVSAAQTEDKENYFVYDGNVYSESELRGNSSPLGSNKTIVISLIDAYLATYNQLEKELDDIVGDDSAVSGLNKQIADKEAEIKNFDANVVEPGLVALRKQYYSQSINNYYVYEVFIPIYMALNTFGLASLNAWDGTHVDINTDANYIMAPQIGAGQKHLDNTFSGILMGAAESYDNYKPTNEDKAVGLLGYHHGQQSIWLDAHTGKAVFGLPENNQYIYNDDGTVKEDFRGQPQQAAADYTQGRIILDPGGTSQIGKWKLGSRMLYNIPEFADLMTDKVTPPYTDYDAQNKYYSAPGHIFDIPHDQYGVLLNSNPPYLSIKGKALEKGGLYVDAGDSLEIQLDPQVQQSPMAIYRHYKDDSGTWQRQIRVGIDPEGRFFSNAVKEPDKENNGNGTSTYLGDLAAFEATKPDNSPYRGVVYESGALMGTGVPIIKVFAADKAAEESTLYITGGAYGSTYCNEYDRPISIHGKSMGLYISRSSNKEKMTDARITLEELSSTKFESFFGTSDSNRETYLYLTNNTDDDNKGSKLVNSKTDMSFILGANYIVDVKENETVTIGKQYSMTADRGIWSLVSNWTKNSQEENTSLLSTQGWLKVTTKKDFDMFINEDKWRLHLSADGKTAYVDNGGQTIGSNTFISVTDKDTSIGSLGNFSISNVGTGGSSTNSLGIYNKGTGGIEISATGPANGKKTYMNFAPNGIDSSDSERTITIAGHRGMSISNYWKSASDMGWKIGNRIMTNVLHLENNGLIESGNVDINITSSKNIILTSHDNSKITMDKNITLNPKDHVDVDGYLYSNTRLEAPEAVLTDIRNDVQSNHKVAVWINNHDDWAGAKAEELAGLISALTNRVTTLENNMGNYVTNDTYNKHTHYAGYEVGSATGSAGDPSHAHTYDKFHAYSTTGAYYTTSTPKTKNKEIQGDNNGNSKSIRDSGSHPAMGDLPYGS